MSMSIDGLRSMPIESRSRQRPDNPPPGGKAGTDSDFDCDRVSFSEGVEYAPAKYATGKSDLLLDADEQHHRSLRRSRRTVMCGSTLKTPTV